MPLDLCVVGSAVAVLFFWAAGHICVSEVFSNDDAGLSAVLGNGWVHHFSYNLQYTVSRNLPGNGSIL